MNDPNPNDAPGEPPEGSFTFKPSRVGCAAIVLAIVGLNALGVWPFIFLAGVFGGGHSSGLPPFVLSLAWLLTAIGTLVLAVMFGVAAFTRPPRSRVLEVLGIATTVLVLGAFLVLLMLN